MRTSSNMPLLFCFSSKLLLLRTDQAYFRRRWQRQMANKTKKYHIIRPIVRVRCVYCSLCMNVISARAYRIERIPAKNAIALNVFGAPIRYQMPWNDKKPFHIRVSECKSKTLIASFILNAFNLSIKQRNWRPLIRCIHTPTNRSEFRWPLLVAERMDAIKINIQFVSRLA